jgi:hypothetical protein
MRELEPRHIFIYETECRNARPLKKRRLEIGFWILAHDEFWEVRLIGTGLLSKSIFEEESISSNTKRRASRLIKTGISQRRLPCD